MPYSSISQHELRSERAADFVKMFKSDNSGTGVSTNDNHLYVMIAREDDPQGLQIVSSLGAYTASGSAFSAGDGQWADDENPPTVTRKPEEVREFWSKSIGAKKVTPANINMVIPRINWVSGTIYSAIDLTDSTWYSANDYYVMNSSYEVWLCVYSDGGTSTSEPVFSGSLVTDGIAGKEFLRDGTESIYVGADGYIWKYLYKMTPALIADFLLTDWMAVPCTDDSLWGGEGSTDDERIQGRDDSYMILGARHVLIRTDLDAGPDGSGKLPSGLRYRQRGLVKNPCLLKSTPSSALTRATGPIYYQKNTINGNTNELEPFVGDVLYLENRSPIARELNQTEEFKTILAL